VLKRGRRQLELANRRLVVQQTKLDHLKTTHARKRKDLEAKVTAADRADSQAKLEHQKAEIETQIALSSARFKVEDLGEQIREVEKKLREKGDTH